MKVYWKKIYDKAIDKEDYDYREGIVKIVPCCTEFDTDITKYDIFYSTRSHSDKKLLGMCGSNRKYIINAKFCYLCGAPIKFYEIKPKCFDEIDLKESISKFVNIAHRNVNSACSFPFGKMRTETSFRHELKLHESIDKALEDLYTHLNLK